MDLDLVREFTVLAESCNYQVAADSLSLSQSALSKHIQKLEEQVGLQLFDRSKRTVSLNENGRIFLSYARQLCKIYDECENALHAKQERDANTLNVGFIRIHDQYSLIEHLTAFCLKYPEVQMSMIEQNGDQLKSKLTSGECDFTFTAETPHFSDEEYNKMIYRTDRLIVLLPKNHPLAGREKIALNELENERFIEHSMPLEQKMFADLCEKCDFHPDIIANINYGATIMRMINQGIGVSVLSEGCVEQYSSYDLVKAELEPSSEFNIYLIYKKKRLSPAAKKFISYFQEL